MQKILYDEYKLLLKGKAYDILIPKIPMEEAWVLPELKRFQTGTCVEGDYHFLQNLWDALVTSTMETDKMIFLPIKHIPQIIKTTEYEHNYDIVFYNHKLQFKRHYWKILLRMMKLVKPHAYVVSYSVPHFLEKAKRKWEHFRRSSRYFSKKYWPREWVVCKTLFMESSVELNCENVDLIYEFMQRKDLDEAADTDHWFPCVYILGMEYYYTTKKAYEKRLTLRKECDKAVTKEAQ